MKYSHHREVEVTRNRNDGGPVVLVDIAANGLLGVMITNFYQNYFLS